MNNELTIIRMLLDLEPYQLEHDINIKDIVLNKLESTTHCKLYNKDILIKKINDKFDSTNIKIIKEFIFLNLVPEIDFNSIFKSKFSIIFNNDDINIYYKNIKLSCTDLDYIKDIENIPVIPNYYIDNLRNIITKFINKNLSVKFNCINIPIEYWKLFEIKCKKNNSNVIDIYKDYDNLQQIINGTYYNEKINNSQITKLIDEELRLEILCYLDDTELEKFHKRCNIINKIETDGYDVSKIESNLKTLFDIFVGFNNKIYKIFIINIIYKYITINNNILQNKNFKTTVVNKMNEMKKEIKNINFPELKLFIDIEKTFNTFSLLILE